MKIPPITSLLDVQWILQPHSSFSTIRIVTCSRGNSFEIRGGRVPDVVSGVAHTKKSSELRCEGDRQYRSHFQRENHLKNGVAITLGK